MQEVIKKKRAAILARCSSEANVCSQVFSLKQFAQNKYVVEDDDIYGDQISGSSAISERAELKRLMQNIEAGKKQYAAVLVQDATRLAKSAEQLQELINWFATRNIAMHFQDQNTVVVS